VYNITEVDTDPELHAPVGIHGGVALGHYTLDRHGAFHCIHNAAEHSKNSVSGCVDDTTAVVGDHREEGSLMAL